MWIVCENCKSSPLPIFFSVFVINPSQTPYSRIYPHLRWCVSFVFLYFYFLFYFRQWIPYSVSLLPERKTQPHCAWNLFVTETYTQIYICITYFIPIILYTAAKHSSFNSECMCWTLIIGLQWILYSIFGVYLPDAESAPARDQSGIEVFLRI